MVRSMYSGVSGMRTHQTRMDAIGNNIANVNTYGFKSSRATFRDIYYQTINAASSPTAAQGGVNPSQVGGGSKIGGIDLMMSRSTFSMTDQTMDMAIDGDGFFQVQDAAGNTYYTRAGMLNFDSAGNLVDMQGNYVLGINGDPTGRDPASERIQVALPAVEPAAASVIQTINGKEYTITASNNTIDGNININFSSDTSIADDTMVASISSTGIIIKMNPDNTYANWAEFNEAMNNAITVANNGQPHPAGDFTIAYTGFDTDPMTGGLTAAEITSTDYSVKLGTASFGALDTSATGNELAKIIYPTSVGSEFSAGNAAGTGTAPFLIGNYNGVYGIDANGNGYWTISLVVGNDTYEGTIPAGKTLPGEFNLKNTTAGASENDYIVMKRPSFDDIVSTWEAQNGGTPIAGSPFTQVTMPAGTEATASEPSRAIGFSGTAFPLRGGTAGGPQTLADMTGISIGSNGIIVGLDSMGEEVIIGRIILATFANASGLNQDGSSNYTQSVNSGEAQLTIPGMDGAGGLVGGTLELSNVDLSREFTDMITTQRGYQANSRIITVSDTMLEELINLKR